MCLCMFDVTFSLCRSIQVGLFRKSGVKSRIQALRQMNESSGADGGGVNYEGQSAYDVADMLKQYFRDLPEPLLTSKLSETFLQIYQCKNTHRNAYINKLFHMPLTCTQRHKSVHVGVHKCIDLELQMRACCVERRCETVKGKQTR